MRKAMRVEVDVSHTMAPHYSVSIYTPSGEIPSLSFTPSEADDDPDPLAVFLVGMCFGAIVFWVSFRALGVL